MFSLYLLYLFSDRSAGDPPTVLRASRPHPGLYNYVERSISKSTSISDYFVLVIADGEAARNLQLPALPPT